MKPTRLHIEFADTTALSIAQAEYDYFGPAHETMYILTYRCAGIYAHASLGIHDAIADRTGFSRTLGSMVETKKLDTPAQNELAWLLTLARSPNATQWAPFLETLHDDAAQNEAQAAS